METYDETETEIGEADSSLEEQIEEEATKTEETETE